MKERMQSMAQRGGHQREIRKTLTLTLTHRKRPRHTITNAEKKKNELEEKASASSQQKYTMLEKLLFAKWSKE